MAHPDLDPLRVKVAAALAEHLASPAADRGRLLGVTGSTLLAATAADTTVLRSATMPAFRRYTGVVHAAADLATLSRSQRSQVRIVSGLWGLVGADDPVPAYRLKMSASLPGVGKLSTAWRAALTAELAVLARRRVVFDLLPQEHSAAWDPAAVDYAQRVTVHFVEERADGTRQVVAHNAKAGKGLLARFLIGAAASSAEAVEGFAGGGYALDRESSDLHSKEAHATFVRVP
jgi:cytoplasmic iron level regulating protein YaaA (DUF328/UPF0246 family)